MGSGSLEKSAADHNGNRLFCQGLKRGRRVGWRGSGLASKNLNKLSIYFRYQQISTMFRVTAAPMYNFNIPTQLKNWIDLVARAGVTFRYTETGPVGLVENTRALVISPRGGMHVGSATDLVTPYMRTVLGFIGIKEVDFIYAEGMGMGPDAQSKGMEAAKAQLEALAI